MYQYTNKISCKGFGLIEIVVSVSVLSLSLVGIATVVQRSLVMSRLGLQGAQANFLLEEGSEVMRFFRDKSFANISKLGTTTTYYLTFASGAWATTTTANTIDGIFTRKITVSDVRRDVNDDIASTGTYDSSTKKLTVILSWSGGVASSTKNVQFYLSDI